MVWREQLSCKGPEGGRKMTVICRQAGRQGRGAGKRQS